MKYKIILIISVLTNFSNEFSLTLNNIIADDFPISFPKKDNILILTSYTIYEALNTYPNFSILFYSTYSDSQSLFSIMKESSNSEEMKKINLVFAQINIDYYPTLIKEYNIKSTPSIIYFQNGKKKYTYNNVIINLTEFFYKRLISKTHLLTTLNEIKKYENPLNHKFIYFGNDQKKIHTYERYAALDDFHIYGIVKDKSLIKNYNKEPDTIVLYTPFKDIPYIDIKNITIDNINNIFKVNQFPLLWDNCTELYQNIFNNKKPSLFLITNNDNYLINNKNYLKNISLANREKMFFGICCYNKDKDIIKYGNITNFNIEPNVVIFDLNKKINKYKYEDYYNKYSNEYFEKFIRNFFDKKLIPSLKSEEIPNNQEGPVFKLVYKNFRKEVINNDLNIFVKFYSIKCYHCTKLEQPYKEMAIKLKNYKNIRIAEYDMDNNDFDEFLVDNYPKLIFFKSGDKKNHIIYKGNKNVEDMMNFVLKNSGYQD